MPLYAGFPFMKDFPLSGISLYKGFPFTMDFPLYGIYFPWGHPCSPHFDYVRDYVRMQSGSVTLAQ